MLLQSPGLSGQGSGSRRTVDTHNYVTQLSHNHTQSLSQCGSSEVR